MNSCTRLRLLLWKNMLVQIKRVCYTIFLLVLPLVISSSPLLIRSLSPSAVHGDPKTWQPEKIADPEIRTDDILFGVPYPSELHLAYTPDTPAAQLVMNKVKMRRFDWQRVATNFEVLPPADDEEDLIFRIQSKNITEYVVAVIVFQNLPDHGIVLPDKVEYKLRFPDIVVDGLPVWDIRRKFREKRLEGPWHIESDYNTYGFLQLQRTVNEGIMLAKGATDNDIDSVQVEINRMPYPPYTNIAKGMVALKVGCFAIVISALLNVLLIVKDVSQEKETRLKETLLMMGVSNCIQWLAWFIKHIILFLVSIIIFCVVFTLLVGRGSEKYRVIGDNDASIFFILLVLYAVATINFAFLITTLFNKSFHATAASAILFLGAFAPSQVFNYENLGLAAKIPLCFIANVAMPYGIEVMITRAVTGKPVSWVNIAGAASKHDSLSMFVVFIMLIVDAVLYMCIALYIEAVWPGEYGIPQPWNFAIQKCCSCLRKTNNVVTQNCDKSSTMYSRPEQAEFFEDEPTSLKAGIRVCDLRKEFGASGRKVMAVDGFSMSMYEGQITVLLGHNGAGKTTALNMISGLYPPSSGTAIVNECDIWKDISGVRSSLGVCPQHDTLFPTLTVLQHLKFFCKMKGVSGKNVNTEVNNMMEAVGLTPMKKSKAKILSGGMKRRLSAAIALIGGPKVVIFDEPTSGLDPSSRRSLWEIMQSHREGRTIVLTTHFMDEADALGDRIAIMADGKLECCGSPLFLKSKYGAGYHFVVAKNVKCNMSELQSFIRERVPQAELESDAASDATYLLPMKSKPAFAKLFADMEQSQKQLNVDSFGISVTTMEEVFIKVGHEAGVKQDPLLQEVIKKICQPLTYNTGCRRIRQQYLAYFEKRLFYLLRNLGFVIAQILLPILLLVAQLFGSRGSKSVVEQRVLDASDIAGSTAIYSRKNIGNVLQDQKIDRLSNIYNTQLTNAQLTVVDLGQDSLQDHMIQLGTDNLKDYINNHHIGALITAEAGGNLKFIAHYNAEMSHAAAISVGYAYNTIAQFLLAGDHSFVTTNHPQLITEKAESELNARERIVKYTPPELFYSFLFLSSAFIVAVVREKVSGCKQLQFVSGGSFVPYWVVTFLLDYFIYLVVCSIMVIICSSAKVEGYGIGFQPAELFLLLMLWGWLILVFCYVFANIFGVPSSGYIGFLLYLLIADFACSIVETLLMSVQFFYKMPTLQSLITNTLLVLVPSHLFKTTMDKFNMNQAALTDCNTEATRLLCEAGRRNPCCSATCGFRCTPYEENVFAWALPGIGRYITIMICESVVLMLLLLYLEYPFLRMLACNCFKPVGESADEDSDVAAERNLVQNLTKPDLHQNDDIIVRDMSKRFRKSLAVNNLSLRIKSGECFGLLGVNGAGKTTTFRMLTGEIRPTAGTTYVKGNDVRRIGFTYKLKLGYCPQFDALIDQLTGREALVFFARLRGIKEELIADVVSNLLKALTVEQHADKCVAMYSGGNKRKISMGVAIIGNPECVFLDEPTTGMDPVAKRCAWDVLSKVRTTGCIVVLTTHSMEESEALCTRLVIMVNGKFRCLGGLQHLKSKFGRGYTLVIKVHRDISQGEADVEPVKSFISFNLPGSVLEEAHQGMLEYSVPPEAASWSRIFSIMEKAQTSLQIEDYSVSQTTLDQVFMNFARVQSDSAKK